MLRALFIALVLGLPLTATSVRAADVSYTPGEWSRSYANSDIDVQDLVNQTVGLVRRAGWTCSHVRLMMRMAGKRGFIVFCNEPGGAQYTYDVWDRGGRWVVAINE
ncbi:hypothetical protein F1188_19300 [Roseospira marina]|uniref:PepSY domain-containing protein n=1 Tax=Roseospira marina TaxID=140057 RepID=A0A5M6I698_9PROT|nr:hypothetical protein [Roseospira marina]KAA5603744.1 hypothetical protein F1188_19300 [Roseospira marina]MBB4316066.1 hypothetical protein [Roseospira marina]MBB5089216.1 hypothetical protein [Roseospira marina]